MREAIEMDAVVQERELDLALSQDQVMLGDSVERFLKTEVDDNAVRKLVESPALSHEVWQGLCDLGVPGLMIPENHGGAGLGLAEMVVVAEKCGAAALPAPLLSHVCAALALHEAGETALLAELATGARIATVGFGSSWIERADAADVVVIVEPDAVLILDPKKQTLKNENGADLTRPSFSIAVDGAARKPISSARYERLLGAWRIMLAADAWGIGHRFITSTRDYAVTRETFGRKIGEYQSIKHPLADMLITLSFAQMLLRQAARLWDAQDAEAGDLARLAKSHITHEVVSMARGCVEMMGAYGFTWDGGDHIWLKRAMFDSLQGGAPLQVRRELAALRGWNDPQQDRTLTRMWRRKL
jgi:alkylation response protein AidB-like acyl-CoA dehydrogenase